MKPHRIRRAIILSSLLSSLATPAAAQVAVTPPDLPTVVTSGEAVLTRVPDRVFVMIAAETRSRSPRDAQRENASTMTTVQSRLKAAGVAADAMRTVSYDLQPEFDFTNNKRVLRGYVVRNAIEVRLDAIDRLGEVLDVAVESGATSVAGVRYDLKDRDAVEQQALREAVALARRRAEAAAAGARLSIDRILRIEEQHGGPIQPLPVMAMRAEAAPIQTPISPGQIEIRAAVILSASLK